MTRPSDELWWTEAKTRGGLSARRAVYYSSMIILTVAILVALTFGGRTIHMRSMHTFGHSFCVQTGNTLEALSPHFLFFYLSLFTVSLCSFLLSSKHFVMLDAICQIILDYGTICWLCGEPLLKDRLQARLETNSGMQNCYLLVVGAFWFRAAPIFRSKLS